MARILSGIQPSGILHLGNYIGALQQWKQLQQQHDAYFCIVNLHALTTSEDPDALRENTLRTAALYIACGIDPKEATIFVQSHVPAHTELAWILATHAAMGDLERMTQYKDKVQKGKLASVGLFTYPVLMAADILLYQADLVPVGEDQTQHVEFTRSLAERFNNKYGDLFTVPELFTPESGARIMGLDNPENKMSKSASSEANYIALTDDEKTIQKKFKKAVTDSGSNITFDKESKPAVTNLLTIYQAATGKDEQEIEQHFEGKGYGDLKTEVADATIEMLRPIQEQYEKLMKYLPELERILEDGAATANDTARQTLHKAQEAVGLR